MILLNYDLQRLPPLHSAAGKGDAAEIDRLLDLGAAIEERTAPDVSDMRVLEPEALKQMVIDEAQKILQHHLESLLT